jgi:hypothetical protein
VIFTASKPVSPRVKGFWAIALIATFWVYAGAYRFTIANPYRLGDFFQEWASGRNYFEGLPVYLPQEIAAWKYLGVRPDHTQQIFVRVNGHPPPCVLVSLPLAKLDYAAALGLWNALSLVCLLVAAALALRLELGTCRTWLWLPVLTIALANPFAQHVILGQFAALMLLLIVAAVWAEETDRSALAGVLLGTAAAIKLFPALLFVYFLVHRKWRAIAAGGLAFACWHGACLALMGLETYEHFVRYSMPEVLRYRDFWLNYSITGMWFKLFDCTSGQSLPLVHHPSLANFGAQVTNGLLIAAAGYAVYCNRLRPEARRSSLALLTAAMILTSPVAWDHYFLLLLWPLVRLGKDLRARSAAGIVFLAALFFLWLNPLVLYAYPSTAARILVVTSWPFYALLAIFALGLRAVFARSTAAAPVSSTSELRSLRPIEPAPAAGG